MHQRILTRWSGRQLIFTLSRHQHSLFLVLGVVANLDGDWRRRRDLSGDWRRRRDLSGDWRRRRDLGGKCSTSCVGLYMLR